MDSVLVHVINSKTNE